MNHILYVSCMLHFMHNSYHKFLKYVEVRTMPTLRDHYLHGEKQSGSMDEDC